jgi:hypothetical protein
MRYALFVMLLACGDKDEDSAVLEVEEEIENEEAVEEESESAEEESEETEEEGE